MRPAREFVAELDDRYSSDGARPTEWADAVRHLEKAQVFWLSTVRRDGRPHVTPLLAVWLDDAVCFCTGHSEQKARNLDQNPHCSLTTGCNELDTGLDLVVEGVAVDLRDEVRLRLLAGAYEAKYGREWHFEVRDGAFHHEGGEARVFEVSPTRVYAFGKGEPFTHTRWRFIEDRES